MEIVFIFFLFVLLLDARIEVSDEIYIWLFEDK